MLCIMHITYIIFCLTGNFRLKQCFGELLRTFKRRSSIRRKTIINSRSKLIAHFILLAFMLLPLFCRNMNSLLSMSLRNFSYFSINFLSNNRYSVLFQNLHFWCVLRKNYKMQFFYFFDVKCYLLQSLYVREKMAK